MTPRTVAHQAPLSMEFSRQEYWSGLPFPSPGKNTGVGTIPFSKGSSQSRDQTQVFCIAGRFFFLLPEPPGKERNNKQSGMEASPALANLSLSLRRC